MKLIHHDRYKITINDNEYDFGHFLKLVPDYSVPFGFHTRIYERGIQHYITDGHNLIKLPVIDAYCDAICNREGELARLIPTLRR